MVFRQSVWMCQSETANLTGQVLRNSHTGAKAKLTPDHQRLVALSKN